MSYPIGIDFGSNYARIACYSPAKGLQILQINDNSSSISSQALPTVIAFSHEQGLIYGDAALNQINRNAKNTFLRINTFLGPSSIHSNQSNPQFLSKLQSQWDLTQTRRKRDPALHTTEEFPSFNVAYKNNTLNLSPEELSAALISKLMRATNQHKQSSHAHGHQPPPAVINVPCSFTLAQRQALRNSCLISGITSLRIVSNPSAIALAYAHRLRLLGAETKNIRHILVVDFGASKCDVGVVEISSDLSSVKVLGMDSALDLGGDCFDDRIGKLVN